MKLVFSTCASFYFLKGIDEGVCLGADNSNHALYFRVVQTLSRINLPLEIENPISTNFLDIKEFEARTVTN
jgi:hypothetical protein